MTNQGLINTEFIFNVAMVSNRPVFSSTGYYINLKNKKIHDQEAEDGFHQE